MKQRNIWNTIAQFALPFFTIVSFIAISLKFPGRGLLINLIAQPFRLYSSRKSYKEAGQIGIFITTIIIMIVLIFGVINYFFL